MSTSMQRPDPEIPWPAGHAPRSAVVFAQNTIDIAASPETVWSLLVDCMAWPAWYKHCTDVSVLRGPPHLTAISKFRFKTLGLYFEPEVEVFRASRSLIWSAKGPAGTRGAHAWQIQQTSEGCRVVTEEAQTGWLLRLIGRRTRRMLLTSHEEWLRPLKVLAETKA